MVIPGPPDSLASLAIQVGAVSVVILVTQA